MYIQSSVLLLSALSLIGVTSAAPTPVATAPSPLRLPLRRIATTNKKTTAHLFNKRDEFTNANDDHFLITSNASDTVPLLNDIDLYQYGIQVQVGEPGQEFLLLFDTGSSDTWVPSGNCSKDKGCLSGRQYDPSQSSTYQGDMDFVNITYGIGSATGHYFVDRLQVGDQDSLSVPSQTLVKMDDNQGPIAQQKTTDSNNNNNDDSASLLGNDDNDGENDDDDDTDNNDNDSDSSIENDQLIDGIFAAGFPDGSSMAQTQGKTYLPFAMNLWENKVIPAPMFSLSMDSGSTTASDSEWIGQVTFGAVDDSIDTNAIQYTPVLQRNDGVYSHWMASVKGFQFDNGTNTNFRFTAPTHFLIDSGSNFIYLPHTLSDQLAQLVSNGTAQWDGATYTVDCALMDDSALEKAPVLNVMFPRQDNPNASFPVSVPVSKLIGKNGPNQCVLFFVPSQTNNVFTLGNLWLRNFVSVFDFGQYRMGFGSLFGTADSDSSSSLLDEIF